MKRKRHEYSDRAYYYDRSNQKAKTNDQLSNNLAKKTINIWNQSTYKQNKIDEY